jgi:lantibiotic modifying enzyme
VYQIQWCYGSVGIGLTRLRAFQLLSRPQYREEAEAAIRRTIRDLDLFPNNWQPNYSLCHGLAGNS